MDPKQKQAFEEAVERKKDEAEERSRAQPHVGGPNEDSSGITEDPQSSLVAHGREQDTLSARDKNAGKGKKTADKWNQ
jgi:hypothetical protein